MTLWTALEIGTVLLVLFVADRLLLRMERKGWIYYRNSKPGSGAIGYHMLETSAAFDPGHKVVQEISVLEEKQESDAGDPLGRSDASMGDEG